MAPLVQVVFLIDVNYFKQWDPKYSIKFEHWKSKLYLCCFRLLTEFGAQTDKENVRWAFKFYNSKKFKPDLSHKVFSDFTISSLKKFEEEINNITNEKQSVIETRSLSTSTVIETRSLSTSTVIETRSRRTSIESIRPTVNKQFHIDGANENSVGNKLEESKYTHSYILNKSLQEILLDYNWDSFDISSPVKCLKVLGDNQSDLSSRYRSNRKSNSEVPTSEGLNFVIAFTDVPKNIEESSLFIGKKSGGSSAAELFKSLFDQATLHGFKDEKKLRFHLVNVSSEKIDTSFKTSLQIDFNKLYGGLHEIDNLVQDAEKKISDVFQKKSSNVCIDTSIFVNNQCKNIKGTELCMSNLHWWNKKRVSSRNRVLQPGPLLVWEDVDGMSFLKIQLELLSIQGSCSKQWKDIYVKGLIKGNAMNLLGIGLPSSLLYVCHAPDTIFPVVLTTLSEQNLFMILQMESGSLVGLAPWVGGVGCLVLFSSTQLISPLTKCKSNYSSLDDIIEKGVTAFVLSAIKKVLKNTPEMPNRPESSSSKRFRPQMTRNWYPVNEVSLEKLNMRPPKRSSLEQAMFERLQKKYRPQMPRPLSGSHLPPQSLIDVTQPTAAAAIPDVPSTLTVTANLRSSKINVSRAQKLVKNSKIVTAQMRVKELQAEEQEQQAACERKTIEAQNRAKKSIAIVTKTMKDISNPQDKDELAQALIRLRDNTDSVSEFDNGMLSEDLYSTAQSVVNLALMHIRTNFGHNSVESELRDLFSREVLLSAKQVSCKCEEKYQPRQFKLQTLLLLEVLWVLGYSRPNITTPNKRRSPRKKKDIGEEYTEEILKLLRMMSLKYDPATVGEFLRHTVVPNYQESLGEILVEIFEELNQPLPASLAPYANGEDDHISPVKPMSVKSHTSSVSNGPNSCETGANGVKEGTKPSSRPLLKRETSRQIIVPHVKRPLQRFNTMKEQSKTKVKGSSKRELKSVCRNLFDKRDKLKRSHTVASFRSSQQRTPAKDGAGKRKHSETKSPLKTPLRSSKKREMLTPNATKAKILVPETPAHAVKTTVFNKHRLLKSTGSTLIAESPDIKGESKRTNVPRRQSLPLTRRTSFYSGASSRNFEKGKHQLRVSRIKGQLERRSSISNSDSLDASFIFSEIIQKNNRMELQSSVRPEEESDKFFLKGKLKFGLDDGEEVEPHRPSLSCKKHETPKKRTPQKGEVDSPLKKVRRSLSLMTPVKESLNSPISGAVSKSRTSMELARLGSPGKLLGCTSPNEYKITSSSTILNKDFTPRKSSRIKSPCKSIESIAASRKHRLLSPCKISVNITPRKSPRKLTNNLTSPSFFSEIPNKLTENMTPRKSSMVESPSKLFQNSISAKPSGIVNLGKLSQTTPRKSPRKRSCKYSPTATLEKQSEIPNYNSKASTSSELSNNNLKKITPRKTLYGAGVKKCYVRITPRKVLSSGTSSLNRNNYLSPKNKINHKLDASFNSPTTGSAKGECKLTCDELFANDSSNSCDFMGFNTESENNFSSDSISEPFKDNITDCITPGKRVQFSFDSTPTKCNTSVSKLSLTPKSILKTPHKSPGKTPIKIGSLEEKDINVSAKRVLESTPNKSNTKSSNYFRKPSPFLFSPKLAFDAYTPPIQKENIIPSTVVNELFKNSTPTHFEALLHSPITSVERKNTSADKIGLVKKATNSHMKSHRKLQLPLCSPSKKSPKKEKINWEFKEILNSPKKILLDACTEFEMVSPSKKCVSSVKTDLVFHKDQDEKTISKLVEMSFQEEEKVIQELPVDQVDLRSELKIDERILGHVDEEQCVNRISENDNSHIPKETALNSTNDSQEFMEYELSYKDLTEPSESMEYEFSSEPTEPVAKGIRADMKDLNIMASLLDGLEKDKNEKISESEGKNSSQNFEPFYRKISHQDSDSGISVSNVQDSEIYLKEDINNLISFLASPCKMTSKAVEVCEQSIISSISNDNTTLDSSRNSSTYNEPLAENVLEREEQDSEMIDIKGIERDKFSTSNTCLRNNENGINDSTTHSFLGFPDSCSNNPVKISHDDENRHNTGNNICIFECEDINSGLINQTDELDVESRDSPVISPSDTEDEKEFKEYPDIDLAHFCSVEKVTLSIENKITDTDVTDQTDMTNYELSPEIPLDMKVCQYNKDRVTDISSTKRKLVFMNGELEENHSECINMQESLKLEYKKIKLSKDSRSEKDIKSMNAVSESQTLSCDIRNNENFSIGSASTLMEDAFAHEELTENIKINSLSADQGVIVEQASQYQLNSIPVISETVQSYEEINTEVHSEFVCHPSIAQCTLTDEILSPTASTIPSLRQSTLHSISHIAPTCVTFDTLPSTSCSNHSNASLSDGGSHNGTPCNSLGSTVIYPSALQGALPSASGDSPTKDILPALPRSCSPDVFHDDTLSAYHDVPSNMLHSNLPNETLKDPLLVSSDSYLSGTRDTSSIVSYDSFPITSQDPSVGASHSASSAFCNSPSSVICDTLPSAADTSTSSLAPDTNCIDKREDKLDHKCPDSNFMDVDTGIDVEKIDISKNIVLSPLKERDSYTNVNSPSTSLKGMENVTPRRSNRKGKQTSFFESPINFEEENYDLLSPVFSSRKKQNASKLVPKLRKTSRKLYDTQSEKSDDNETLKQIKDQSLLPHIPEEEMPLSSADKGIHLFSPKGLLSDSFEVVSPMKNIVTFEKEHFIPEEQKSPIVIRIRRKKKTNPSPMRPERASKIKAIRNIEKDIECENKKDDELIL